MLDLISMVALVTLGFIGGFILIAGTIIALDWNGRRLNKKSKKQMYDGMIEDFREYTEEADNV